MSSDPNYELIARIWKDSLSTSEESVFVEVIDGELHLTVMTDTVSSVVTLPPERVKDLRKAIARAEKRLT